MDWKICAVDDLRRYKHMKVGVLNSSDRLRTIDNTLKRARLSGDGAARRPDSQMVDAIVESERLRTNISAAQDMIKLIERGLDSLSEDERKILELFYMNDRTKPAEVLQRELGYSPRSIYRIRDRALEKFTLAMYGVEVL